MVIDSSAENLLSSLYTCTGEVQWCPIIINSKLLDLIFLCVSQVIALGKKTVSGKASFVCLNACDAP